MTDQVKQSRTMIGRVTSDVNHKTIVVEVERRVQHPLYKKILTKSSKHHAHDENNEAKLGDIVAIKQSRPRSKQKCWELVQIVTPSTQRQVVRDNN